MQYSHSVRVSVLVVIFETTLSEQQLNLLTQPSARRSLWGCVQTDNSTVWSNQRRRWFQWGYCVGTVGGQTEKKHATQCHTGVAVLANQIRASCMFLLLLCISVYLATQINWFDCTETLKCVCRAVVSDNPSNSWICHSNWTSCIIIQCHAWSNITHKQHSLWSILTQVR